LTEFNPHYYSRDLVRAAGVDNLEPSDIAAMFRRLFLVQDPHLGEKCLFVLLSWLGEYDISDPDDPDFRVPPLDDRELQRWAAKREIANKLKAAIYADLSIPQIEEPTDG
jgi:hypothetical protein